MILSVHNNQMQRIALLDSSKADMLTFYDDEWHRYLKEATSTFDFTVPKNGAEGLRYINEKAYISFQDDSGRDHLFTVVKVEESDEEIRLYTEECNLEILNETAPAYRSEGPHSFAEYFGMQWLIGEKSISGVAIGINEISDHRRSVSWEGSSTKLERLRSLARRFDAEIEFQTKLNGDGSIRSILVNVYRKHSDTSQGVGTRREDKTLYYGGDLTSVRRSIDKTGLYTAISPIGTDGLRIKGAHTEKDAKGNTLYYSTGGTVIYAPKAAQKYPAIETGGDKWILLADWSYETKDPEVLYRQGLSKLKAICEPAISYEIKGTEGLEIGDTVTIHDKKYDPVLIIEARVSEQIISFTDPARSENTYANIKALENKVSKSLQNRALEIAEDARKRAQDAKERAKEAVEKAQEQEGLVSKVELAAREASESAKNAQRMAASASESASTASAKAEAVKGVAEGANAKAQEAKGLAGEAKELASKARQATDSLQTLIRQGDEGLTVGKSYDGKRYGGSYVLIGSDGSVSIRGADGAPMASFEKDTIKFAPSNRTQSIQFWGGMAALGNYEDALYLRSPSVYLSPGDPKNPIEGDFGIGFDPEKRVVLQGMGYRIGNGIFSDADFGKLKQSIDTDYVVKQYFAPKRSSWSWRKWASGYCEMWVIGNVGSTSGWSKAGNTNNWKYSSYYNLPIKLTALEDVQLTTDWDGWVTSDSEDPNKDSLGRVHFTIFQPTGSDGLDKAHTVRIYVRGRYQ